MRLRGVLCPGLLFLIASVPLGAQAVVSTHSGVINYSEGAVFLDNSALSQKFGSFPSVADGSTLRTEKGRAEILLTPGVFLRIDENSAIRMNSSALTDTRVEFLRGAGIVDSNNSAAGNPCVLIYKNYQIRFPKAGVYRINSEPEVFQTYTGEAEIQKDGESPKPINESNQFFFGIGMVTEKYGDGMVDAFSEWARNRAETIAADNRVGSQSTVDPNAADPNDSPFTLPAPPPTASSVPWFGQPNYGVFSGPLWADNAFFGTGFYGGFPFMAPPVVIYVVPRWYGRNPSRGIPRRPVGYPHLDTYPHGSPYPRLNAYRPPPLPVRSGYGYVRPSVGRVAVGGPRYAAPQRMTAPPVIRPMGPIHR